MDLLEAAAVKEHKLILVLSDRMFLLLLVFKIEVVVVEMVLMVKMDLFR